MKRPADTAAVPGVDTRAEQRGDTIPLTLQEDLNRSTPTQVCVRRSCYGASGLLAAWEVYIRTSPGVAVRAFTLCCQVHLENLLSPLRATRG